MLHDEFLTVKGGKIGPEVGIGHHLGHEIDAPVLLLKSCIGNRSLGWDLLPPGSEGYEFDGMTYAGYREESPLSWKTGTEPEPIGWYAGMQYDGDVARAKKVLEDLDKYYPGAKEYEVAGFFWWQGDKDRYKDAHASKYEENLVRLIAQLRADFGAPEAKFVIATLGQTKKGADGNEGKILEAMLRRRRSGGTRVQGHGLDRLHPSPLQGWGVEQPLRRERRDLHERRRGDGPGDGRSPPSRPDGDRDGPVPDHDG